MGEIMKHWCLQVATRESEKKNKSEEAMLQPALCRCTGQQHQQKRWPCWWCKEITMIFIYEIHGVSGWKKVPRWKNCTTDSTPTRRYVFSERVLVCLDDCQCKSARKCRKTANGQWRTETTKSVCYCYWFTGGIRSTMCHIFTIACLFMIWLIVISS